MRTPRLNPWKLLGLAGVAGVAAGGVLIARDERTRRTVTPDEVRARLHARHAAASGPSGPSDPSSPSATPAPRPATGVAR